MTELHCPQCPSIFRGRDDYATWVAYQRHVDDHRARVVQEVAAR